MRYRRKLKRGRIRYFVVGRSGRALVLVSDRLGQMEDQGPKQSIMFTSNTHRKKSITIRPSIHRRESSSNSTQKDPSHFSRKNPKYAHHRSLRYAAFSYHLTLSCSLCCGLLEWLTWSIRDWLRTCFLPPTRYVILDSLSWRFADDTRDSRACGRLGGSSIDFR